MKKKEWVAPQIYLIAINTKHIPAAHEGNYVTAPTAHGHKFYFNTPNKFTFASGIANTVKQYLS